VRNAVGAAFEEQGHRIEFVETAPGKLDNAMDRAILKSPDVLLVAGGDGSVSLGASKLAGTSTALGVLPAGTMNLYARTLKLPIETVEAARRLAAGNIGKADTGQLNGRTFIHQAGVGIHPRLIRFRAHMSFGSRFGKIRASAVATLFAFRAARRKAATIAIDGKLHHVRGLAIAVTVNPLGEGHLPFADRIDAGTLGVYYSEVRHPIEIARLGIDLAFGNFRHNPRVQSFTGRHVVIRTHPPRHHQLSIDGELADLPEQMEISIAPKSLNVLLPAEA
jgi:diacylglycerol kinase family enzyme